MNNIAKREYWANLLKSRDAKPKGSKGKTMTAGCYWKSEKNSDMFGCCDLCACFDACCSIFYVIGNSDGIPYYIKNIIGFYFPGIYFTNF